MLSQLRPAIVSTLAFTLILGVGYPLAVTGIASLVAPAKAQGSLVRDARGQVVGSALIGQAFTADRYLWGRPSAAGLGYDASASSGSNLGPLNPALAEREARTAAGLRKSGIVGDLPPDAVTASASGLDPDISPAFAMAQVSRIARARGAPEAQVRALVAAAVQEPVLGFIGQSRVNVLKTNLALDARFPVRQRPPA